MQPSFTRSNVSASYQLRYHFGWKTHRHKPTFERSHVKNTILASLSKIAQENGFHILETELEPRSIRTLFSLGPHCSPSSVTRIVKGNLSAALREILDSRKLWSRVWFFRSNGNVTNDRIRDYVAGQFEHHDRTREGDPCGIPLACSKTRTQSNEIRSARHVVFEYNLHVVLVVRRRFDFLDHEVSGALIKYWQRVCEKFDWQLWDIEVVPDHAHLFVGANPSDSPEDVVLGLMNNAEYFLRKRFDAALRDADLDGVWQPGFYVGTAGSATTAQIKAFLRGQQTAGS